LQHASDSAQIFSKLLLCFHVHFPSKP